MNKISVLIPTYNAEQYIYDLLTRLYNQDLRNNQELEIIIVDSASKDRTISIIEEKFPETIVKSINNQDFDHGGTRNYLASLAKGNILLFMTQDAIPCDNQLISKLVDSLGDEEVVVSYARQIPREDANLLEKFARSFNYPEVSIVKSKDSIEKMGVKAFFNSNVCSAYKRDWFLQLGKFPTKVILNEDMIFAAKSIFSNKKVYYCAEAKVFHSHNYGLIQQFKRYFDIGMAFEETKYLLEHVSNEKEGIKMIKKQMSYLIENRKYHLIIYALIESGIKLIAYRLGKIHKIFPYKLKKKLSAYMK
ncbi:glycosyltransferase [Bacillus sp. RA(2023)]|uniref:glycosyltransferase family 2 protein n=1 Tax=Bacillus TaxID=1386 RepID=UPI000B4A9870|nr:MULTISPECIES: glycosyltransferase [Bacillus]WPU74912.1 glycosyltransferase [Bacillus sp. RA(2023)]